MGKNITECPDDLIECVVAKPYCVNGLCCHRPNDEEVKSRWVCLCDRHWIGKYCDTDIRDISESRKDLERASAVAAISAVIGVIVIALFVTLVVLQIKYYRRRKKLRRVLAGDEHELDRISRPDASEKVSKRRLITQPGYSWRESVRKTSSKASQKFRSTLSRSVPDDLFQVGLKLAIFGGCRPKLSPSDHQSAVGKAEVKAVTTQRCFSAGPALGDGQTVCDNASASNRPIVVQMPSAAAATAKEVTEDTVK